VNAPRHSPFIWRARLINVASSPSLHLRVKHHLFGLLPTFPIMMPRPGFGCLRFTFTFDAWSAPIEAARRPTLGSLLRPPLRSGRRLASAGTEKAAINYKGPGGAAARRAPSESAAPDRLTRASGLPRRPACFRFQALSPWAGLWLLPCCGTTVMAVRRLRPAVKPGWPRAR
jgi:hypothetical protein